MKFFEILRKGKRYAEGIEWDAPVGTVQGVTIHVAGQKPETLSTPLLMSRLSPGGEYGDCEIRWFGAPPEPEPDPEPADAKEAPPLRLVCFLYLLLRDDLTAGAVARLVEQCPWHVHSFSNAHLEGYATEVAAELTKPISTNGRKRSNAHKRIKRPVVKARRKVAQKDAGLSKS